MSLLFNRREPERRDVFVDTVNHMRSERLGSWASVPVTPDAVLGIPAVWACEQYTAGIISQLPFDQYRTTADGRAEVPPGPLLTNPSADVSPEDWRFQAIESAQLHGGAYGHIVARDRLAYPTQIELLHPERVQVRINSNRELEWKVDNQPFAAADMWHMPGRPQLGSPLGMPILHYMAQVAGTGIAARKYGADWFKYAFAPTVIAQPETDPGETGAKALKQKLIDMMRSREPVVFPQNIKLMPWAGANPSDSALVELLQANATDVAQFYLVPPELVGGSTGDSMTYSNTEARILNLLAFAVSYWLTKLEHSLSRSLPRGQFVKANESAIVRTDIKTRTDVITSEMRAGLLTQNEGRRLLDRESVTDGDRLVWPPMSTAPPAADPAPNPTR